MGNFIDKMLNSINLGDDDEYDEDYMFDEEDDINDTPAKKSSIFGKRNKYNDDDDEEEEYIPPKSNSRSSRGNVVPMRSGRGMEVCLVKPSSVDDSSEICDTLLSGRAVVINLEGIHVEVAQRIIDFTSGACYSMGGNLQKISNYIFIVTPKTVELSGDFQEMFQSKGDGFDISTLNLNL